MGVNAEAGACLYRLVEQEASAGPIVEIGSCFGLSTIYLATAARRAGKGKVWAIDPHTGEIDDGWRLTGPSTYDVFLSNMTSFGLQDIVQPMRLTSEEAAKKWSGDPITLLFIDGLHSYEAVTQDISLWFPFVKSRGVVVFDDYMNARVSGVKRAVDEQMTAARVQLPLKVEAGLAWTIKF